MGSRSTSTKWRPGLHNDTSTAHALPMFGRSVICSHQRLRSVLSERKTYLVAEVQTVSVVETQTSFLVGRSQTLFLVGRPQTLFLVGRPQTLFSVGRPRTFLLVERPQTSFGTEWLPTLSLVGRPQTSFDAEQSRAPSGAEGPRSLPEIGEGPTRVLPWVVS